MGVTSVGIDVAEAMRAIHADIFREFWEIVKAHLCDRLQNSDPDGLWEICDNQDIRLMGIVWKNGKRGQDCFSCAFEAIYGETLYGIRRGRNHQAEDNRDVALVAALKNDSFVSNNWWPGWRYLHNEDQAFLPKMNKEKTVALLRDNLSQTHTLAVKSLRYYGVCFCGTGTCLKTSIGRIRIDELFRPAGPYDPPLRGTLLYSSQGRGEWDGYCRTCVLGITEMNLRPSDGRYRRRAGTNRMTASLSLWK